jgi:hypothetical protein
MKKYLRGLVIAVIGVFGTTGCTTTEKNPGTVRPARPDEPRKVGEVPPSVRNLLPEEVTPDNFEHIVKVVQNEMDRDERDLKRTERRTAGRE